ncbi:MAG: universal stress protein [Chloroflexi bacterium]|nr:universal stress protein [Chloroflexota bacterium]
MGNKMYERILIPLDGSKVGESALAFVDDLLSKLSPEVKAEIILLQVVSRVHPAVVAGEAVADVIRPQEELAELKEKAAAYLNSVGEGFRNRGAAVRVIVSPGDASEEIIKCAEETNADLVAMSTHGRSGLSRWAFGSVTDRVLRRRGKAPILLVKAPGR